MKRQLLTENFPKKVLTICIYILKSDMKILRGFLVSPLQPHSFNWIRSVRPSYLSASHIRIIVFCLLKNKCPRLAKIPILTSHFLENQWCAVNLYRCGVQSPVISELFSGNIASLIFRVLFGVTRSMRSVLWFRWKTCKFQRAPIWYWSIVLYSYL